MLFNLKKKFHDDGEVYLRVKVRPNAGQTKILEVMDDETVKIDISAKPERKKANTELIKFLAKEFDVDKNNAKIISGPASRIKLIKITI